MLEYNRGEWSELYAAVKSLVDGIDGKPACKVLFPAPRRGVEFLFDEKYLRRDKDYIQGLKGSKVEVPRLRHLLYRFFEEIKKGGRGGVFNSKTGETIMDLLQIGNIKSGRGIKADVVCDDKRYSVKSHLGSPPSIINPSNSTCAVFEITGGGFKNDEKIRVVSGSIRGLSVKFLNWVKESKNLSNNLDRICNRGSFIMGRVLQNYINSGQSIGYLHKIVPEASVDCVKKIMKASFRGMKPRVPWKPEQEYADRILIVKQNGALKSYSFDEYVEEVWNRLYFEQDGHMSNRKGSFQIDGDKIHTVRAGVAKVINSKLYLIWPLQIRELIR